MASEAVGAGSIPAGITSRKALISRGLQAGSTWKRSSHFRPWCNCSTGEDRFATLPLWSGNKDSAQKGVASIGVRIPQPRPPCPWPILASHPL